MVGFVNAGPHTGKSQFYITLGNRSYLDGDYTVFGELYDGMDVVREIVPGDLIETVRIVRVGAAAGAFRPTTESFLEMREEVRTRVTTEEEAQRAEDEAFLESSWPHAILGERGVRHVILREGRGTPDSDRLDLPGHCHWHTRWLHRRQSRRQDRPGRGARRTSQDVPPG